MYTNYLCWYLSLKNTILQTITSYKTYIMYAGCSLQPSRTLIKYLIMSGEKQVKSGQKEELKI